MYSINSLIGNSSNSSSSSKAIGGMATGLDTATLIKGMTASTRLKIAKQKQNKQILSWQTDAYRGVSNKLIEFSKKYTSFTSSTNLLSSSFYTKTDISTSGNNASKVTVSGSSTMTDNISIVSATKASEGGAISTKAASGSSPALVGSTIEFSNPTASSVSGEAINIKYNGNSYKISFDATKYTTNTEFVSDINKKLSEITITGSSDKLSSVVNFSENGTKIKIASTADDKSFEISEFSTNLKSVIGFETAQFTSGKLTISSTTGATGNQDIKSLTKSVDFAEALTNSAIRFSFNNTARNISFNQSELEAIRKKNPDGSFVKIDDKFVYDEESKSKFTSLLQSKLDSAFGKDAVDVSLTAGNELKFVTSNTGAVFKITETTSNVPGILGLEVGDSNRLKTSTAKLSELGINAFDLNVGGTAITGLTADSTVQELMDAINAKTGDTGVSVSYIEGLDRFEFKSTSNAKVAVSGGIAEQLFIKQPDAPATPITSFDVEAPTKAELTIKYGSGSEIKLTSNNNTFNIDGLNINVNETFAAGTGDVKLSASTDTNKILSAVKDMVKDYNEIVDLVNKEYSTKPNRNYPPLTDEQRKELSESEIKAWEEKAKTGMLFGNSDMSELSSNLRNIFFSTKENMAALNEIGISSSPNWKDNGKIVINEEKLKKAIETDPENIKDLFTKSLENKKDSLGNDVLVGGKTVIDSTSGGIMARFKNLTDKYTRTEGSTKGILINKAGNAAAPLSITKNTLLDQMNSIDNVIKNLNRTLATEEKRYQKQFTRLETAYSKLNAQSGWLRQQFGG